MNKNNKVGIFKLTLTIFVIILIIGIIIYLFPVMQDLASLEGQMEFKKKVDASGVLGFLFLCGLQIAQIFLVVIPGEPIEILAGMCYGVIWGTVFIMLSACVISAIIFVIVKKYGRNFVLNFFEEKRIEKIEKSKLFQNPKKIEMIMLILFLIPGTPKCLLVYVAGLLPIKTRRFILISTFARFPSVISSTIAGENLVKGEWKTGILLYLLIIFVTIITVFIINVFDTDKTTEDVLKTIKEKE